MTREEFKATGNRMQRAGQANAVPLGPFKTNNGYANKAMFLLIPGTLCVNRDEQCLRQ